MTKSKTTTHNPEEAPQTTAYFNPDFGSIEAASLEEAVDKVKTLQEEQEEK